MNHDTPSLREDILGFYQFYLNSDNLKQEYHRFFNPASYGYSYPSDHFYADEEEGYVSYRTDSDEFEAVFEDRYFEVEFNSKILREERKAWHSFLYWIDHTGNNDGLADWTEDIQSNIISIGEELKTREEFFDYYEMICESLIRLHDSILHFDIASSETTKTNIPEDAIIRLRWKKSTGLFFIVFSVLVQEGIIECMDGKKSGKYIAEVLQKLFHVKPSDRSKEEYKPGALYQNLKPGNQRFDRHNQGRLRDDFRDLVIHIIKKIK